jgi:hypothetical protein
VEVRQALASETILQRRLRPALERYEYAIIDTPPSLGVLTVNGFTAATEVLVPIACEFMALRGLRMLIDTLKNIREVTNPDLQVLGIVVTKFSPRIINSRKFHGYLANFCQCEDIRLFSQTIKQSVRFAEAPGYWMPLVSWRPKFEGIETSDPGPSGSRGAGQGDLPVQPRGGGGHPAHPSPVPWGAQGEPRADRRDRGARRATRTGAPRNPASDATWD